MDKLNIDQSIEEIKMLMNEDETSEHTEAEASEAPKAKKKNKSGAKPVKAKSKDKTKGKGKAKAAPAKKAKKAAKQDPEGYVSLATVCDELGISGATARRKLRAAEYARDGRWSWKEGSRELEKIKKLLSE